jgi:hypothetical protein
MKCSWCSSIIDLAGDKTSHGMCRSCAAAIREKFRADCELTTREILEAGKRTGLHSLSELREHRARYRQHRGWTRRTA